MNVLVVGCGRLGTRLASILDRHGHDVAVIDSNEDAFQNLGSDFSGITVVGMPLDMTVLKKAGVENCDAMAVVTPDDNLNITVSQIAQEFFGVKNVVARISDPAREKVFQSFGLKTICPTKLAEDAMFTALTQPLDSRNLSFETATAAFHTRAVEEAQVGLPVTKMPADIGETVFGVLHKDGSMELYSAEKDAILAEGDKVIFAKIID
jgi:trk system potassium uptake protein TrkA